MCAPTIYVVLDYAFDVHYLCIVSHALGGMVPCRVKFAGQTHDQAALTDNVHSQSTTEGYTQKYTSLSNNSKDTMMVPPLLRWNSLATALSLTQLSLQLSSLMSYSVKFFVLLHFSPACGDWK